MARHKAPSRTASVFKAISYGPVSYLRSVLVGFLAGSFLFVIADATLAEHNVFEELPFLLSLVAVGASAALLLATGANYLIGRQVRDEVELQRRIFAGRELPAPVGRPDVPGIDLLPATDGPPAMFGAERAERASAGRCEQAEGEVA